MRSSWIISAIAGIGLAVSASAEQVDQSTRQQIERLVATYAENFNKQNAAGIAGLYTEDGMLVSPSANIVKTGQLIAQSYQDTFKSGMNHLARSMHEGKHSSVTLIGCSRFGCNRQQPAWEIVVAAAGLSGRVWVGAGG